MEELRKEPDFEKLFIEEVKTELKKELASLKEQEIQISKTLSEKYGDGTINLETGKFTKVSAPSA